MKTIENYLEAITDASQKMRMIEIFTWIEKTYPRLEGVIKWNQPMFTDHGTFIIGFNMAKHHLSFNPEPQIIDMFKDDIHASGYETTNVCIKI